MAVVAQNVGIGTASPLDKLHITGGNMRVEGSSYPRVSFYNYSLLKGFVGPTAAFHMAYINKSTPDGCGIPCDDTLVSFINPTPGERAGNAFFSFHVYRN